MGARMLSVHPRQLKRADYPMPILKERGRPRVILGDRDSPVAALAGLVGRAWNFYEELAAREIMSD